MRYLIEGRFAVSARSMSRLLTACVTGISAPDDSDAAAAQVLDYWWRAIMPTTDYSPPETRTWPALSSRSRMAAVPG
jgi:hypothetical protein